MTSQSADTPSGSAFPVGTTLVTITAQDAAGNSAQATFTVTVTDPEAPVITAPANITQATDPGVNTATVNFTIPPATDNVDGVVPVVVTSAPTAGLNSGSAFPIGVTTMTVAATDSAGNTSQAQFTITVTNTGPTITSASSVLVPENQTDVIDVESTDDSDSEGAGITYSLTTVTGGGVDNGLFNRDANTGVLTFITAPDFEAPTDANTDNVYDVQITATDSAGGTGVQNIVITVTDVQEGPTAEQTQRVIADFMLNRANHIFNNQPSMIDRFRGTSDQGGPMGFLQLNGTRSNMNLAFSTSRSKILAARESQPVSRAFEPFEAEGPAPSTAPAASAPSHLANYNHDGDGASSGPTRNRAGTWDIWTEIYGATGSSGTSDSSLWVGYFGAHYFISEDTLVGLLGQLDWASETNGAVNSSADGFGRMIGPYVAGRMGAHELFYEARAAWGTSSNDVSPIGTFTNGFDTERWMVLAKLSGDWAYDRFVISPHVRIAYFEETQKSYFDSFGTFIPEQTISLGEFRFGPSIRWEEIWDDGTVLNPHIGVDGVFNFNTSSNNASQGFALGNNDLRVRVNAGLSAHRPNGTLLSVSAFYDGIGAANYHSFGGNVRLVVPIK